MAWDRNHRERKSPRTRGWDYSQTAAYFITICTKDRAPYFGKIQNGIMGLSRMELIVHWFWQKIPRQFDHIALDAFIVMANHIHGILRVNDKRNWNVHNQSVPLDCVSRNRVPMDGTAKIPGGATGRHNRMLSDGSLGRVIRWYKGRCTFEIHQHDYNHFQWQGRYWDHIIQDAQSLNRIRNYIYNNPRNWKSDLHHETD